VRAEDRVESIHSTIDEAIDAIKALAEAHVPTGQYKPIIENVPIIGTTYHDMKEGGRLHKLTRSLIFGE